MRMKLPDRAAKVTFAPVKTSVLHLPYRDVRHGRARRTGSPFAGERLPRHDTRIWHGANFKEVDVVDHASVVQRNRAAYVPNDYI